MTVEGRTFKLAVLLDTFDECYFGAAADSRATAAQNEYYSPSIRGRLFPESDRTSHGLHLTWQHRPVPGVPPYSLEFAAIGASGPPSFRRADTDDSGLVDITDAIFGLQALFIADSPRPGCLDAADSNDDGRFDLSDAIYTLRALFLAGEPPPAPGPQECGGDPTDDGFGCGRYGSC